jgi:hypothetical protein
MRKVIYLVVLAIVVTFTACETKKVEETTTIEETTDATDMAETTAAPIDTAGIKADTLLTSKDSAVEQK